LLGLYESADPYSAHREILRKPDKTLVHIAFTYKRQRPVATMPYSLEATHQFVKALFLNESSKIEKAHDSILRTALSTRSP